MADEDEAASKPLAASDRHFYDTVTVIVGSRANCNSFIVHTSIVKQRSTFFESALSGRPEANSKGVELPEDDPPVFDLYLKFLYQNDGSIRLDYLERGIRDDFSTYGVIAQEEVFDLYAKVWILADKLGDHASSNLHILSLLSDIRFSIEVPAQRTISYVWAHTRDGSPLRKFCVESWTYLALDSERDMETRMSQSDLLPHEFLVDILKQNSQLPRETPEQSVVDSDNEESLQRGQQRFCQYDRLCPKPA